MRFREVSDRVGWNSAVKALGGSVTQSWEWGSFYQSLGWRPLRLLDEGCQGGVQLLFKDLPGGFSVAYAPYGPLAANASYAAEATESTVCRAREYGAYLLKIEPRWDAGLGRKTLDVERYVPAQRELPRCTLISSIPKDPREHLEALPKDARYGVLRAYREGVQAEVLPGECPALGRGMDEFLELLEDTSRRQGFHVETRAFYRTLMQELHAYLVLARHDDVLLAGGIVVIFGDEAYYLYGGSTPKKGNLYAPYLVQWMAMEAARREGCSRYDMFGIPCPPPRVGSRVPGFYRFKKKFGGALAEYPGASVRILNHRQLLQHRALTLGSKGYDSLRALSVGFLGRMRS